MPLGNFTRANLENAAVEGVKNIISSFNELEELRARCAVELAAGTLDSGDFYQGDPANKANILGALDDLAAVYAAMSGSALPTMNYRRYVDFLVGV